MPSDIKKITKSILDAITRYYKPIKLQNNLIIYTSMYNKQIYINLNSLTNKDITVCKWKRRKTISDFVEKPNSHKHLVISKNQGSWISKVLIEDFGNYYGKMIKKTTGDDSFLDIGTYIHKNIKKLYEESNNQDDPFHIRVNNNIIRANRTTNFINLTDITSIYKKDIRNWKKHAIIRTISKNTQNTTSPGKAWLTHSVSEHHTVILI